MKVCAFSLANPQLAFTTKTQNVVMNKTQLQRIIDDLIVSRDIVITFQDLRDCHETDFRSLGKGRTYKNVRADVKNHLGPICKDFAAKIAMGSVAHLLDTYMPRLENRGVVDKTCLVSSQVGTFLSPRHQYLLEELAVALYHDNRGNSRGFLSDVKPNQLDRPDVVDYVNQVLIAAAKDLNWLSTRETTRARMAVDYSNQQAKDVAAAPAAESKKTSKKTRAIDNNTAAGELPPATGPSSAIISDTTIPNPVTTAVKPVEPIVVELLPPDVAAVAAPVSATLAAAHGVSMDVEVVSQFTNRSLPSMLRSCWMVVM